MKPRIELLPEKKLVGKSLKMSLADDRTTELWREFMPERKQLKNTIGSNLYSVQIYEKSLDVTNFDSRTKFVKWAAVEVSEFGDNPLNFESFVLKSGLYAVFIHKGTVADFPKTIHMIFSEWLPNSGYELDDRPHFEILGNKYKNNDPDSEEEVWIPIK